MIIHFYNVNKQECFHNFHLNPTLCFINPFFEIILDPRLNKQPFRPYTQKIKISCSVKNSKRHRIESQVVIISCSSDDY